MNNYKHKCSDETSHIFIMYNPQNEMYQKLKRNVHFLI